jgi:hypothetical protein
VGGAFIGQTTFGVAGIYGEQAHHLGTLAGFDVFRACPTGVGVCVAEQWQIFKIH